MEGREKKEVFLQWARRVFDENSYYSLTLAAEKWIENHWDEIEDAFIARGWISGNENSDEFEAVLNGLGWSEVQDIAHMLS